MRPDSNQKLEFDFYRSVELKQGRNVMYIYWTAHSVRRSCSGETCHSTFVSLFDSKAIRHPPSLFLTDEVLNKLANRWPSFKVLLKANRVLGNWQWPKSHGFRTKDFYPTYPLLYASNNNQFD